MKILLCAASETMDIVKFVGLIGGMIGAIAGGWALYDRFKNRRPNLIVFAPYHWTANDVKTTAKSLSVFFRFSNLSLTPTYLFLESLKVELFYEDLQQWKKIQHLTLSTDKIQTDFSKEQEIILGINKAKFLNLFDDCLVKFGEPLCGYLIFEIRSEKYSKLRGEVMDFRHKKITFEVDFEKQKKHDPQH